MFVQLNREYLQWFHLAHPKACQRLPDVLWLMVFDYEDRVHTDVMAQCQWRVALSTHSSSRHKRTRQLESKDLRLLRYIHIRSRQTFNTMADLIAACDKMADTKVRINRFPFPYLRRRDVFGELATRQGDRASFVSIYQCMITAVSDRLLSWVIRGWSELWHDYPCHPHLWFTLPGFHEYEHGLVGNQPCYFVTRTIDDDKKSL